jgi:catechol 2,3-dioxygenase-like lactoylglutathione lyase family enzyme
MRLITLALSLMAVTSGPVPQSASDAAFKRVGYREGILIQLAVSNLDRSVEFYQSKLGFRVTERRNDLKFVHLDTNTPGVEMGLNEVPAPDTRGPILNFTVRDAAAARKALEADGVKFVGETVTIPGKVVLATFVDPDGHRLRLAGLPPAK